MKTVCIENMCTGCNACVIKCPVNAIRIEGSVKAINAVIDTEKCISCNACTRVCQNVDEIDLKTPVAWFQGWDENNEDRAASSSGGFAHKLATYFTNNGGLVCSCLFENGKFIYRIVEDSFEVDKFRGSKYVKSDTGNIYITIKEKLKQGKQVLFIGLPCHVAGLLEFLKGIEHDNLYTVDLICHGSPSKKLLELFFGQYKLPLEGLKNIEFRNKGVFQVNSKAIINGDVKNVFRNSKGIKDCYTIAFLKGLIYTENCYSCKFARTERISDITIGDSWGSELSEDEKRKGISLAICQTKKGIELINNCGVHIENVNPQKAIVANHQLQAPSVKVQEREKFFDLLQKGKKFNSAVRKCFLFDCFKQDIKKLLIKIHILSYE